MEGDSSIDVIMIEIEMVVVAATVVVEKIVVENMIVIIDPRYYPLMIKLYIV